MDVDRQIGYWRTGSLEDMDAAAILCEKGRYRHALFFAHLSVEKMLKAHVTRETKAVPPKIHNLVRLADMGKVDLQPEQLAWLRAFNLYQLEGRYPDLAQVTIDRAAGEQRLAQAKDFLAWLTARL